MTFIEIGSQIGEHGVVDAVLIVADGASQESLYLADLFERQLTRLTALKSCDGFQEESAGCGG